MFTLAPDEWYLLAFGYDARYFNLIVEMIVLLRCAQPTLTASTLSASSRVYRPVSRAAHAAASASSLCSSSFGSTSSRCSSGFRRRSVRHCRERHRSIRGGISWPLYIAAARRDLAHHVWFGRYLRIVTARGAIFTGGADVTERQSVAISGVTVRDYAYL